MKLAQTYFDREPGVGHEAEILCWTALRHDCRRRRTEGLYDSILQSFHASRSISHVTTYLARNLQCQTQ